MKNFSIVERAFLRKPLAYVEHMLSIFWKGLQPVANVRVSSWLMDSTQTSARPAREAIKAHRRVSGGQSRSKCAAQVRRANIELLKAEWLKSAAVILLLFTLGVGQMWGADEVYKTAKFGSAATSSTGIQNYTSSSTATYSGFSVDTQNGNNNNNGWALIKFGPKPGKNESSPKTSSGTITTSSSIDKAITKVVVTGTGPISNTSITSTKLILASNSTFTSNKVEISGPTSFTNGEMTFTVSSPTAARYYQLVFNLSNSSSTNGAISISQVDYYISAASCSANPTIGTASLNGSFG